MAELAIKVFERGEVELENEELVADEMLTDGTWNYFYEKNGYPFTT